MCHTQVASSLFICLQKIISASIFNEKETFTRILIKLTVYIRFFFLLGNLIIYMAHKKSLCLITRYFYEKLDNIICETSKLT